MSREPTSFELCVPGIATAVANGLGVMSHFTPGRGTKNSAEYPVERFEKEK
jgi:hypothetical protein